MSASGHALTLRALTKRYGDFVAVRDVSLQVERGQFLTLLGPSGSGKTTILMCIAGFVAPSEGQVLLDGRDITALIDQFVAFARALPSDRLAPVEEALAAIMASWSDEANFTPGERAELDRRLAEPKPEYAAASDITDLLGKPLA
ncbi:ATP-binding cassette domain-containing protein [Leptolyngbya sp. 15MV]|nr:ATP-binding cassette domain-containing protein [Leptolyngbya sp. 15MV]